MRARIVVCAFEVMSKVTVSFEETTCSSSMAWIGTTITRLVEQWERRARTIVWRAHRFTFRGNYDCQVPFWHVPRVYYLLIVSSIHRHRWRSTIAKFRRTRETTTTDPNNRIKTVVSRSLRRIYLYYEWLIQQSFIIKYLSMYIFKEVLCQFFCFRSFQHRAPRIVY